MRFLTLLLLAALAFGLWQLAQHQRARPQDLPWAPLDLDHPIGLATGAKLRALADDPALCRSLLRRAGVRFAPGPNHGEARAACRTPDAVRADRLSLALVPGDLTLSCPLAAALTVWNRQVVRPAARRHLGQEAEALGNLGSWNCRTIAGSTRLSEHAGANAIDIAAVSFAEGQRAGVRRHWRGNDKRAAFLHEIRDGGCRLFSVVLSPDYNAAHADHLHLDMGPARACR